MNGNILYICCVNFKSQSYMKLFLKSLLIILVITTAACSKNRNAADLRMSDMSAVALEAPSVDFDKSVVKNESNSTEYERKVTKTGEIRFQTSSSGKTKEQIQKAVTELKGYISSDNTSTIDKRKENTLEIRIPSANFDKLMTNVAENALKVDFRNVQMLDVTEEFIDLDKRIGTKKELEARYIQLLQKATKVEEILKIEEQIGNLRADIESAEGRLKYLNDQVDFSTLNVIFYEKNAEYTFWNRIKSGFSDGWQILLSFFVVLANLWAIILLIVGIIFLFRIWIKNRKKRMKE